MTVRHARAAAILLALAPAVRGADTLESAEALLAAATGATGGREKTRVCGLTDALADRAAALLSDPDPFVRGIAEWAIAIRVGTDNDRRRYWPRPDPPAWYARWSRLRPEEMLDADYVRQAVALGEHRSAEAMLRSADAILRRATGPSGEVRRRGTEARRARLDRDVAALAGAHEAVVRLGRQTPVPMTGLRSAWLALRRAARPVVMAHPDLDFDAMVFLTRYSCIGPHNLASYSYHPDHYRPGGDIVVQQGLDPAAPVRGILAGRPGPGHLRGMDLWWDAGRVCFAFTPQPGWTNGPVGDGGVHSEPTHVYEVRLDGTGLRALTHDPKWIDTEPAYLPDGGVIFGSDRAGIGSECGGWTQNAGVLNLFRVSADGRTVRRLTVNKDYDRYPHTLDNGTVAFLRWDYAERQFFSCHSLWTVRPDGTMADALYKSHIQAPPYSLRDPRPVPGGTKLVAIACGHHTLAEGAVTVVDPRRGVNESGGMRYITPHAGPTEGGLGRIEPVAEGGVVDAGGLYQTPWPLSERGFLVSYAYAHPASAGFALYYIDAWGNKELLRRDPVLDCAYPMPLRPRPQPPVLAEAAEPGRPHAVCHVSDVYHDLDGVPRGAVKWLRISERVPWPFDKSPRGELRWVPGNPFAPQFGYWTWAPVRVIGIVPVAADGSAHFRVPAGLGVYFQALDERFMEIRRMRSHVAFQPGETRSCLGCHETRGGVTPSTYWTASTAARRPPDVPAPPPWGDTALFDFERMIQPILDRRCAGCHGATRPKGGLDLTATPDPYGFAQSYRSLFGLKPGRPTPVSDGDGWYRKHFPGVPSYEDKDWYRLVLENRAPGQLVAVSDRTTSPWQKPVDASISRPMQFGSHQSGLVLKLLRDDAHRRAAALTDDEWHLLVAWIDANAPYRAPFFQKFDENGAPLARPWRVELALRSPWAAEPAGMTGPVPVPEGGTP